MFNREIEVKTIEVHRPQSDPQILAQEIADNLEKRQSFRRTLKRSLEQAMDSGARGVRIQMSGRLGGSEMARCESGMLGSIPLSTLRTRVDYGFAEASTAQGNIGIKVWVNNGDYLTEDSVDGTNAQARKVSKKPARQDKR
jgi:small subunit ribosomal protein S3